MIDLPLYNEQTGGKALVAVAKEFLADCHDECFFAEFCKKNSAFRKAIQCGHWQRTDGKNVIFKPVDVPPKEDA